MKERPILFTAPMVRALLDGRKTQHRCVVRPQPYAILAQPGEGKAPSWAIVHRPPPTTGVCVNQHGNEDWLRCQYGEPGDRLWVRETHRPVWGQTPGYLTGVDYKADPHEKWERMRDHHGRPNWTPSVHMLREYSRILLEVTRVRVERLHDISEADAIAEGAKPDTRPDTENFVLDPSVRTARFAYRSIWKDAKPAYCWESNPWVWVLEFKRITP